MDELRIGQAQVKLVAPEFPTDQPDLQTLLGLVYEPLLRWKNGIATGSLLSSWQVSDEGDFPVVQAVVFVVASVYVAANLIVDVLYVFLDPRVRLT